MSKRKPDSTYTTRISYVCPVRGNVTQEVEVKVYNFGLPSEPRFIDEELQELLNQAGSSFDDLD